MFKIIELIKFCCVKYKISESYLGKILCLILSCFYIACAPLANSNSPSKEIFSQINKPDQAPLISCTLLKLNDDANAVEGPSFADKSDQRVISSISSKDKPFVENPMEGSNILVDCNRTTDESKLEDIAFYLDSDHDPSNPDFSPIESKTTINLEKPGRQFMALKAIDKDGNYSVKTFFMITVCLDGAPPVINMEEVTLTSSRINFLDVNVPETAIGAQKDLAFLWDFNGDGVYDIANKSDLGIWTTETHFSVYTIFADNREASLRVMNTCGQESSYEIDIKDLDMENIEREPLAPAEAKPYVYIQSDIHSFTAPDDPATNGDIILTWAPPEKVRRVKCELNFAKEATSFTISAHNVYGSHSPHGVRLRLNTIPTSVSGEDVAASSSDGSANIDFFAYSTDGAGDNQSSQTYLNSKECSIDLRVKFYKLEDPCGGQLAFNLAVNGGTIAGEFACPALTSSTSSQILEAQNGKFFCDFGPAVKCPLGGGESEGGEGGGTVPIQ